MLHTEDGAKAKNIKIHTGSCDNTIDLASRLPIILGLKYSQLTTANNLVCTTKRDAAAPAELTFEVAGSNSADVDSLQSSLESMADTASEISADSEVIMVAAEDVGTAFLAEEVAVDVAVDVAPAAAGAAAAEGVSAGVVAGAVVGGVVGAAVLAGAAIVVRKKVATRKTSTPQKGSAAEPAAAQKPKGAGANVFDFDPTNHTSITGRTVASKV